MINASDGANRQGRRSAVRGRLLMAIGLVLCVGCFVVIETTSTSQPLLAESVQLLAGLTLLPIGIFVFRRGGRWGAVRR